MIKVHAWLLVASVMGAVVLGLLVAPEDRSAFIIAFGGLAVLNGVGVVIHRAFRARGRS